MRLHETRFSLGVKISGSANAKISGYAAAM
jgi:hypothetical protein